MRAQQAAENCELLFAIGNEVITTIALWKNAVRPRASVSRPSPSTPSRRSNTLGCAFSIYLLKVGNEVVKARCGNCFRYRMRPCK